MIKVSHQIMSQMYNFSVIENRIHPQVRSQIWDEVQCIIWYRIYDLTKRPILNQVTENLNE